MANKKLSMALVLCMGASVLACSTVGAEQKTTEFIKDTINGKTPSFSSAFKKEGIWDNTTKTYTFTKDSTFSKNFKGIVTEDDNVTIKAPDVTLTFESKQNMPITVVKNANKWRQYSATKEEGRKGALSIDAKKLVVKVDGTTKSSGEDAFAIAASASRKDNTPAVININSDLDLSVKNLYRKAENGVKEKDETFTGGIAAIHDSEVNINGNVKIRVESPKQDVRHEPGQEHPYYFVGHYYLNGIYAGLHYDTDRMGSKIKINGDVDIAGDGTGIQANSRSTITINGGGRIEVKDTDKFEHYALIAEESVINMNVSVDESGKVLGSHNHKVEILGNVGVFNREDSKGLISGNHPSAINLALTTKDSALTGLIINHFAELDKGNSAADKKEIREATGVNLFLQEGATWNNELRGRLYRGYKDQGNFTGSKLRTLTGGETEEKAGFIKQNDLRPIEIGTLAGHVKVAYKHSNSRAADHSFVGGEVIVNKADKGAALHLMTDNKGVNMDDPKDVEAALMALAKKGQFKSYKAGGDNLTGTVSIAEGLTSSAAKLSAGDIDFSSPDGVGKLKMGSSETNVMKGERLARTSGNYAWRHENMRFWDLNETIEGQFLVDLGRTKFDSNDNGKVNYSRLGLAYGKAISQDWDLITFSRYGKGTGTYENGAKDKLRQYTIGAQGTYHIDSDSALDIMVGHGTVKHDFTAYPEMGDAVKGNYRNTANGISLRYSKEINAGHVYYKPMTQFSYAHIGGADYNAWQGDKALAVQQDAYTSMVAGLGLEFGKRMDKLSLYGHMTAFHEFKGDINTSYKAADGGLKKNNIGGKETWIDAGLGVKYMPNPGMELHLDVDRSFSGTYKKPWELSGGVTFKY